MAEIKIKLLIGAGLVCIMHFVLFLSQSYGASPLNRAYKTNPIGIKKAEAISITTLIPSDDASKVAPNSSLMIIFSDSVHAGTGNITIKRSSDDTNVESIDVTSAQVTISDSAVTITPASNLPDGDSLYVIIDNGAFVSAFDGTPFGGITDNSSWTFITDVDADGDGVYSAQDCNDNDPTILGPTDWYQDLDHDGYGNPDSVMLACSQPPGYVANNQDCNDRDSTINPMTVWYADKDNDGYGDPADSIVACVPPPGYVNNKLDCNDNDSTITFSYWYADADSDGYGNPNVFVIACSQPKGYVADSTDCDDSDPDVHPGAPAKPDGKDNNCDGIIDKVDQTIDFIQVPYQTQGNPPVNLHAVASSLLPVELSLNGPGILIDSVYDIVGAGLVTITASQAGDSGYNAAPDTTISFCVNPLQPAIFISGNSTKNVEITTIPVTGSYLWYLNGTPVGTDSSILVVNSPGTYSLQISVDECASALSDSISIVITNLEENFSKSPILLYPNPAKKNLTVQTGDPNNGIIAIKIVSVEGSVIPLLPSSISAERDKVKILLPEMTKGYYILTIETQKQIYKAGFIKQN